MTSLVDGYRAIVVGASGGIGAAMVAALDRDPRCETVVPLHRKAAIPIDFDDADSIVRAAAALAPRGPFHLIVNAAGRLHSPRFMPEKKFADLDYAQLTEVFRVNTFGPALLLRAFAPLLARDRAVLAFLSAKVGSIGDNRLGGWYSYRASKAALNMIVRTGAIELARSRPLAVVAALHPGTVDTALSAPFRGAEIGRPAPMAAVELLTVLDGLALADSGAFVAYDGKRLPW